MSDWIVDRMYARIESLEAELTTATHALSIAVERVRVLEGALQDVVNPLGKMRRELPEGYDLDGYQAALMAKDPEHLRDIARAALEQRS